MLKILYLCIVSFFTLSVFSQNKVEGRVVEALSREGLGGVKIEIVDLEKVIFSDENGYFSVEIPQEKEYIFAFSLEGYTEKRFAVEVSQLVLTLPTILLEADNQYDTDAVAIISESELDDDQSGSMAMAGLLQSSQDIFMRRVAFDFNATFFKPRGYDSKDSEIVINGLKMNRIENGNVQWQNWGGLNDVTRNQEFSNHLQPSDYVFGGLAGSTYIKIRPSLNRKGLRLSTSAGNRSYAGRVMATYNSGNQANNVSYSLSASRRWAGGKTYFDGTLYNAYSLFGSVEYQFDNYHNISGLAMFSFVRRGKTSPLTAEVLELMGHRYNPYWGHQNGEIRNSRNRIVFEPIISLSYTYEKENTQINADIGYQFGEIGNTRLVYANAQNPEPNYYQKLPSFYINQPTPNFEMATLQREYFLQNAQLNWEKLYFANQNISDKRSAFAISNDINAERTFFVNMNMQTSLNEVVKWTSGVMYRSIFSENYAKIEDLLGGDYFTNYDYFENVPYDANEPNPQKKTGEKWNYFYELRSNVAEAFSQLAFSFRKVNFFVSGRYHYTDYQRVGKYNYTPFQNSYGEGKKQIFAGFSGKIGLTYAFTDRHVFQLMAGRVASPQPVRNSFVNIRNSNEIIPNQKNEVAYAVDGSYILRMPYFKSKLTAYYTAIYDASHTNFFYTEMAISQGVRSDFVSQVVQNIQKKHFGLEFGAEAQLFPSLKLTTAVALGQHTYANNPKMMISSTEAEVMIDEVFLKNYRLPNGSQQAYSLGLEYRGADNWRVGVTANLLTHNYIALSSVSRTKNFFIDPETNTFFTNINRNKARELLKQERLGDVFLMNFMLGKSWLYKKKYISLLLSVNNLLDTQYLSGGFEQSRTANYGKMLSDNAHGKPSFGNRYFVGYGRTYLVNLAISL